METMTVEHQKKQENTELIKQIELNDFFYGLKYEGKYYLGFGQHRLNKEAYDTVEELKKEAAKIDWKKIIQIAGIIAQNTAKDAITEYQSQINQNQ